MAGGKVRGLSGHAQSSPGLMCRLITISGIDASGKRGIFPSNYVRSGSDASRDVWDTKACDAGGERAVERWPAIQRPAPTRTQ